MSDLEAGPELDALVAEKVMGYRWSLYDGPRWEVIGIERGPEKAVLVLPASNWRDADSSVERSKPCIPVYSTDITAAWEVVEKVADGDTCRLMYEHGHWEASFQQGDFWATDTSAPLAICRAALRVVGERE